MDGVNEERDNKYSPKDDKEFVGEEKVGDPPYPLLFPLFLKKIST